MRLRSETEDSMLETNADTVGNYSIQTKNRQNESEKIGKK